MIAVDHTYPVFTGAPQPAAHRQSSIPANPEAQSRQDQSSPDRHTDARQPGSSKQLSREEQKEVQQLAKRDREVRAHEAAHKAAAGSLAGPAHYEYTNGPDGRRYATGGEVNIDTSKVSGDPQATLLKANRIRAAALAPAGPSGQDRRVAAQAARMAAEARAELAQQKRGEASEEQPRAAQSVQSDAYSSTAALEEENQPGARLDYIV
jgi:hypothetical protein